MFSTSCLWTQQFKGTEMECDVFMPKDYLRDFELLELSKTHSEGDITYDYSRYLNKNYGGKVDSSLFKHVYKQHEEYQYLKLIEEII